LYETIQKICRANNLGFKIFLNDENKFVFTLYAGVDRSYDQEINPHVVFSNSFDNLVSSEYTFSKRSLRTVTLIAGEGEEDKRKTTVVGSGTGINRREIFTDAKDISQTVDDVTLTNTQYRKLLEQRGISTLAEYTEKKSFDAVAEVYLVFRYGEHFFMGDVLQFVSDEGTQAKVRVTELIRSKSVSGLETYPKFSMEDVQEYETSGELIPGPGGETSGDYAPLNHTHTAAQITDFLNKVYPIGAIYMSVLSTSPATLFGGTWSAFAPGRVLVGFNSGETEFNTSEKTGGGKTHTLVANEMPVHTHVQDSHNHTQNSHNHTQDSHNHTQNSHNHTQNSHNHTQDAHNHTQNQHRHLTYKAWSFKVGTGTTNSATGVVGDGFSNSLNYTDYETPTNNAATATNQAATAVNQAATATNQAATATNQAATATNNAVVATNQNAGGGAAHNNLQPYITVYMWKRTA
jgi:microcystin-dependent protein